MNDIDFASAPRRMTAAEAATCNRWGTAQMVEAKYSCQAIVLVRSKLYGALPLSPRDIYLGLARMVPDPANLAASIRNPYTSWNEVDPALPPDRIQVMGPKPSSERGKLFVTLLMEAGCNTFASIAAMPSVAAHDELCRSVRDDGVYTEMADVYPNLEQQLQMLPTVVAVLDNDFRGGIDMPLGRAERAQISDDTAPERLRGGGDRWRSLGRSGCERAYHALAHC